jgi:hypothetical protein
MNPLHRHRALPALLVVIAALAVGCGGTVIDDAKTEGAIQHNLETSLDKKVEGVDCPSGVDVEAGETFECAVTLRGGKEETATLKILNEDADVELVELTASK